MNILKFVLFIVLIITSVFLLSLFTQPNPKDFKVASKIPNYPNANNWSVKSYEKTFLFAAGEIPAHAKILFLTTDDIEKAISYYNNHFITTGWESSSLGLTGYGADNRSFTRKIDSQIYLVQIRGNKIQGSSWNRITITVLRRE